MKKENALILHSALETWKYAISEVSSFYLYAFFRKFRTPVDSEPATPLHDGLKKLKHRHNGKTSAIAKFQNLIRETIFVCP